MTKFRYVRGNPDRSDKVRRTLEILGATSNRFDCCVPSSLYFVDPSGRVDVATEQSNSTLYKMLLEYGEEAPIDPDFKYKVGEMVSAHDGFNGEIVERLVQRLTPCYRIKDRRDKEIVYPEDWLEPFNPAGDLSPFMRVLVRDDEISPWEIDIFGRYDKETRSFICIGGKFKWCIPYEGNEYELGNELPF